MVDVIQIFYISILIFSIVIHEFSHGWMANYLGDPTARHLGRLTLNPVPHIDLVGSILIPFFLIITGSSFLFGWAKPVPYNPYNLRDKKNGEALVALAGPFSNLAVALIFGVMIRIMLMQNVDSVMIIFFSFIVFLNIILALFNLLPIPPLDGSKILFHFLPYSMSAVRDFLERNGMILLIVFIIFGGFELILLPILKILFILFTGSAQLAQLFF